MRRRDKGLRTSDCIAFETMFIQTASSQGPAHQTTQSPSIIKQPSHGITQSSTGTQTVIPLHDQTHSHLHTTHHAPVRVHSTLISSYTQHLMSTLTHILIRSTSHVHIHPHTHTLNISRPHSHTNYAQHLMSPFTATHLHLVVPDGAAAMLQQLSIAT